MLHTYLQSIGLTTGPLIKNTSYSGLESLRKFLLGEPQFQGGEEFLLFGNALHEVFLEDKRDSYDKLPLWQQEKVDKMHEALKKHPVVIRLMQSSIREKKLYKKLHGVEMAYILDIKQPHQATGADLKTTVCTNYHDCLKKAISYGYVKQGRIYMRLENLKNFYFIFICKSEPFDIFIISYSDFKSEQAYADQELEFLLYFYGKYGRFVTEQDKLNLNSNTIMADGKGKAALVKINEAVKEHKVNVATLTKATKAADKSKDKVAALISKFPKKEVELYQEKLNNISSSLA